MNRKQITKEEEYLIRHEAKTEFLFEEIYKTLARMRISLGDMSLR